MGLFFDVLSSINNPNQQGSVEGLSNILQTVQQVTGGKGIDASASQGIFSVLGGLTRSALQQQGAAGAPALEGMLGQLAGGALTGAGGGAALQSLFPPALQQQAVQAIAAKTGLNPTLIQTMLPGLISSVLGLLNMGAPAPGARGTNPLLGDFLNSDSDQDVDMGDVFKFADRFLNPPGAV